MGRWQLVALGRHSPATAWRFARSKNDPGPRLLSWHRASWPIHLPLNTGLSGGRGVVFSDRTRAPRCFICDPAKLDTMSPWRWTLGVSPRLDVDADGAGHLVGRPLHGRPRWTAGRGGGKEGADDMAASLYLLHHGAQQKARSLTHGKT